MANYSGQIRFVCIIFCFILVLPLFSQDTGNQPLQQTEDQSEQKKEQQEAEVKDQLFLMGLGMIRLNWSSVEGNEIRFRYSDLGLPADFSTRERASFMLDGTLGNGKYKINGFLNYDPENRITEPPLEFLLNVGNDSQYLSVGDYRMGVLLDSVFSRYYHPFRGAIIGFKSKTVGVEALGGYARGESGLEELPADSGSGPYYLTDAPILRGSEVIYLISKSISNPDQEVRRNMMVRNQDYFIDYDRGSIIFYSPVYPYDEMGNPVYIMVAYQFESLAGHFSRAVYGVRTHVLPFRFMKLSLSYIADTDKDLPFNNAIKNSRGITTLGLNINSDRVLFFGEFSQSQDPAGEEQQGFFGGGTINFSKKFHLYFNAWMLDSDFPTFANKQLQYGYSLFQIFPTYSDRNIFLSPFQFTRNLGAELYPFSLARVTVDEKEIHGFLEYDDGVNRTSLGYGIREEQTSNTDYSTLYLSSFYNKENTKAWGKVAFDQVEGGDEISRDSNSRDVLLGLRQKVVKGKKGDLFVQTDYKWNQMEDFLELGRNTHRHSFSLFSEYITGQEGLFAGYRKDLLLDRENDSTLTDVDIIELGIRRHIYKGLFLDSRFRNEHAQENDMETTSRILSLGGGFESTKFRTMVRYEVQVNESTDDEGRRELLSFFLFGYPVKRMSVNLRYYKQLGEQTTGLSLTERSEEELAFRLLWRPVHFLSLYSQWRYDTNLELFPPLDTTKSNSMASVQGLKLRLSEKFEFLANYKLLKVWGPIDNMKQTLAAELGYLIMKHFRVGVGAEMIDFEDEFEPEGNYHTWVGYLKLVAIF